MMGLSKEVLKREIAAVEAAIKAHTEGAEINKIVLKAFKELKCTPTS